MLNFKNHCIRRHKSPLPARGGVGDAVKQRCLYLQLQVGDVVSVQPEHLSRAAFHPLERDGDEREYETLHAGGCLEAESRAGDKTEEVAVEVVYERGEYHEDGVGFHGRAWQACPSEVVVGSSSSPAKAHAVEAPLGGGPLVVEKMHQTRGGLHFGMPLSNNKLNK